MIYVFAQISHHSISVELAILLVNAWVLLVVASAGNRNSSKALVYMQLLFMATIFALNSNLRCSDSSPASISDDTRDNDQLANKVALQISQHARNLITVNLHLELRHRVSLFELLTEIVSLVHLLHCFFELNGILLWFFTYNRDIFTWIASKSQGKLLIKVI